MLVAGIIGAAFWGKSLTGAAVEALSTVLGMLIGIVATYVAQNYTKGEARTPSEDAPVAVHPPSQPPPPVKDTDDAKQVTSASKVDEGGSTQSGIRKESGRAG